jgi:hypothetical protein
MPHIFRRLFTRKFFLRCAFCAFALLAIIVAAYCEEKWRGQRAWAAYAEAAGQRGVKLWPEDYVQPAIPDAENYAALPCLRELEQARAEKRTPAPSLPDQLDAGGLDSFRFDNKATPSSMVEVRDFFVQHNGLANPSANPAKDIVEFLAKNAPALQQFREATPRRFCRFSTQWGKGSESDRALYLFLNNCAALFRISANARLASGDVVGAADEIRHLTRLSEAMRAEPGLEAGIIIGTWSLDYLASAISEGVITHQWSDVDLQAFAKLLASLDLPADLRFAIASERTFVNVEYERIARNGYTQPFFDFTQSRFAKVGMALYPSGWARQNMVKTNEYFDFLLAQFQPSKSDAAQNMIRKPPRKVWSQQNFGKSMLSRAYWALARNVEYLFDDMELAWFQTHTHLAQTQIVCALERYHRATGGYPEMLEATVPTFLSFVPQPFYEGWRLSYQRQADGYVLWEAPNSAPGEPPAKVTDKTLGNAERVWRVSSQ